EPGPREGPGVATVVAPVEAVEVGDGEHALWSGGIDRRGDDLAVPGAVGREATDPRHGGWGGAGGGGAAGGGPMGRAVRPRSGTRPATRPAPRFRRGALPRPTNRPTS